MIRSPEKKKIIATLSRLPKEFGGPGFMDVRVMMWNIPVYTLINKINRILILISYNFFF